MKPIISGIMMFIILCCAGSIPACGVIFCVMTIMTTMKIGNR